MAKVSLRLRAWIPQEEVHYYSDQYYNYFYLGDNRNSPEWSTMAYRTSLSFEIDTNSYTVTSARNVNPSVSLVKDRSGKTLATYDEGTASATGIQYKTRIGSDDALYIDVTHSVANPGVTVAPPVKYEFTLKLTRTGSVRITGKHTAFPALEFWRKIEGKQNGANGTELVYFYDPRKTGDTPMSLVSGMTKSVDKGLSYTS
ncbi:MAG TPA: DUF3238 domain-containing protein [Candidatus Jeotgalibaca pullicola]|nr:DUF3238 domain-containing protein [Candidatus Jeotgalibaca pullicola]